MSDNVTTIDCQECIALVCSASMDYPNVEAINPESVQTQDPCRIRWNDNPGPVAGYTPYGIYDADPLFQVQAPQSAKWAARCLGFPIIDIELLDVNFYARFEEAISEYSSQVNQFNIRENMSLLSGLPLTTNPTQKNIQGTPLPFVIRLSEAYGEEVGVGGNVDWKKGFVQVQHGIQDYDLQSLWANQFESGSRIEVKRVFHHELPASRIFAPYATTGLLGGGMGQPIDLLLELGGGASGGWQFFMTPVFEDLLRWQAVEFNQQFRRSLFSFEIVNNKLRLFPLPTGNFKVWFEYVVETQRDFGAMYGFETGSASKIGDYSNVPYTFFTYSTINSVGLQWIRKYFLALCKENLGAIRAKYSTVPIPGAEMTLDGAELRSEAVAEKEALISELRENLAATGKSSQIAQAAKESGEVLQTLKNVPLAIYVA